MTPLRIMQSRRLLLRGLLVVLAAIAALVSVVEWLWPRGADPQRYEAAVEEIWSAPERWSDLQRKYNCVIEAGPPLRVAFRQPGGILDNWYAIVYDPSGEVLKARQFKPDWSNWDDPALYSVKKLFGGDLRWAEPLRGDWYRCSFT